MAGEGNQIVELETLAREAVANWHSAKRHSRSSLRIAIEQAKCAVIAVQEELAEFPGDPAELQQLTDTALRNLDCAWLKAALFEAAKP